MRSGNTVGFEKSTFKNLKTKSCRCCTRRQSVDQKMSRCLTGGSSTCQYRKRARPPPRLTVTPISLKASHTQERVMTRKWAYRVRSTRTSWRGGDVSCAIRCTLDGRKSTDRRKITVTYIPVHTYLPGTIVWTLTALSNLAQLHLCNRNYANPVSLYVLLVPHSKIYISRHLVKLLQDPKTAAQYELQTKYLRMIVMKYEKQ